MKLAEFQALAPKCIVCGAGMKRIMYENPAPTVNKKPRAVKSKYYSVTMQCVRNENCFGYMSNTVSIHDVIVVKKFYIGFPKIQLLAVVDEFTQVLSNGVKTKLPYIPFESFLRAQGQILEKIEKLLILADGTQ